MKKREGGAMTRRALLRGASAIGLAACASGAAWPQSGLMDAPEVSAAQLAADPRRPRYHLLPARNWMNDPNGPIYWKGAYHMFFQYNPHAAVWGDMHWNHAVSADMLHWRHEPIALAPTPGSADSYGVFSGSALAVGQRVYQVYTGTRLRPKELATIRDGEDKIQESQCLAYSDDPRLVRWTKLGEPVVPLPPPGMEITGFRDPSAWKAGDWYYMTVGAGEARVGGCVLLYRSRDLRGWEYLHKLTSGAWNGRHTANPCDDGEMWECPDFFALDGGHVLIYSTLGKVIWEAGRLDEAAMTFHAARTGELDLGAFYAPKTQLDAHGRRILWGWIQEKRPDAELRKAGWAGMMSLPRVLRLGADGVLRVEPLPETRALRGAVLPVKAGGAGTVTVMLPGANGELQCAGEGAASPLALTIRQPGSQEPIVSVRFLPERHAWTAGDGREVALQANEAPVVSGFVDGSVVELILGGSDGGRVGLTRRFYYEGEQAPDLQVTIEGAGEGVGLRAKAWAVQPISQNRLTTPA